jgi:hypothetical protein
LGKNEQHIITICLLALLFVLSFFKDDFSPDFLNTPDASLIGQSEQRLQTIFEFPSFWLSAIVYSALFFILPYYIFTVATRHSFATTIATILMMVAILEYLLIFANQPLLDEAIIPKINRFYHSPLFTLFFLAAFTLHSRSAKNE